VRKKGEKKKKAVSGLIQQLPEGGFDTNQNEITNFDSPLKVTDYVCSLRTDPMPVFSQPPLILLRARTRTTRARVMVNSVSP